MRAHGGGGAPRALSLSSSSSSSSSMSAFVVRGAARNGVQCGCRLIELLASSQSAMRHGSPTKFRSSPDFSGFCAADSDSKFDFLNALRFGLVSLVVNVLNLRSRLQPYSPNCDFNQQIRVSWTDELAIMFYLLLLIGRDCFIVLDHCFRCSGRGDGSRPCWSEAWGDCDQLSSARALRGIHVGFVCLIRSPELCRSLGLMRNLESVNLAE